MSFYSKKYSRLILAKLNEIFRFNSPKINKIGNLPNVGSIEIQIYTWQYKKS